MTKCTSVPEKDPSLEEHSTYATGAMIRLKLHKYTILYSTSRTDVSFSTCSCRPEGCSAPDLMVRALLVRASSTRTCPLHRRYFVAMYAL
jgi:hypothetical protein